MSFLFGSSPSVTSTPISLQSSLSGAQQSAQNALTNSLLYGSGYAQSTFPSYTGQIGANVDPTTTSALNALTQGLSGATSAANLTTGTTNTGLGALSGVLNTQPQDLSSYYTNALFNPAEQTLQQTTLPGIMSSAGGSVGGYQSTSESNAVANAVNSMYGSLASSIGGTAYQSAQDATQQQQQALSQLSTITGIPSSNLSTILGAGTTAQTDQQSYLNKLYKDYQSGLTNTQYYIQSVIDYLNTQTQTQANQAVSSSGSSGLLGSLFSGLGKSSLGTSLGNLIVSPSSGGSGSGTGSS